MVIVCVMVVVMFNFISIDGANNVRDVYRTADTRVELEATISSCFERTELDEGFERTYWESSVSYTYEGVSYSGVYYDTSYSEPQLGKVVKVAIDPENPGELLPDKGEFRLSLVLSPIFLTGVTLGVIALVKGFAEELQKKLPWINPTMVAYGLVACKLVGESCLYYLNKGSWIVGIFSAIAAVGSVLIIKKIKKKSPEEEKTPVEA